MYCPKCATQNIEDARFCRGCGADIALVPQAMTGTLAQARAVGHDVEGKPYDALGMRLDRRKEPPRLDKAIKVSFTGLAFLIIAVILGFGGGKDWWYWMLIPAFSMIGGGIAEYARFKQSRGGELKLPEAESREALPPPQTHRVSALPRRNTAELVPPPPSVTEGTTRHLDRNKE